MRVWAPFMVGIAALIVGLFPATGFAAIAAGPAMRVTLMQGSDCVSDCPRWIALQGKIGVETPALLRQAFNRMGGARWPILVDSPGGAVEAALAMGQLIRSRGLTVAVAGSWLVPCVPDDRACLVRQSTRVLQARVSQTTAVCASACVFLLASGTTRLVGPHALVGVHQMIERRQITNVINTFRIMRRMVDGHPVEVSRTLVKTRPVSSHVVVEPAPEQLYGEVGTFMSRMGVAPAIMPLMRATPSAHIHWMTQSEIASTRIATDSASDDALAASLWPDTQAALASPAPQAAPASPLPKPVTWTLSGTATLSLQEPGAPARDLPATVQWILLATPQSALEPGAPVLTGSLDVPGAGLGISFHAAPALPYEGGDLTFEWQFTPHDATRFGAVTSLAMPPVWTSGSHILLMADKTVKLRPDAYRVGLSLPMDGAVGSELRLELGDAAGRHATLLLPVAGPVGALIGAAARKIGRAGS